MLYLLPLNSFMFKTYAQLLNEKKVFSSIRSVLLIHLHNLEVNAPVEPINYKQFENTTVQHEPWGLFEVVSIKSSKGDFSKEKSFLLGQDFHNSTDSVTMRIPEINSPFFCVGSATIEGRVIIPKEGIKTNYIDGKFFSGELSEIELISSYSQFLPEQSRFFDSATEYLFSSEKLTEIYQVDITPTQSLIDSVTAPFSGNAILFHSNASIQLRNVKVTGKVIITSESNIKVDSYSSLNDAILVAPVVKVSKGFNGCLQIFATDSIVVEEGVMLHYPSTICLKQMKFETHSLLEIKSNVKINGAIIVTRPSEVVKYYHYPRVNIDEQSVIKGILYVQGLTDLRGTVQGSTLTDHFYCQTHSGFYLNYLYNGRLTHKNIPSQFGIPFLYDNKWKKCLIKELI